MEEIWKDIKNYEGLYQVSNLGNVKSLDAIINCKGARNIDKHIRHGKLLKKNIDSRGYYVINLSKNSKLKRGYIHRLVADTFLENKKELPCVNHIDGNKLNNRVDNLEWCTYAHNNKEAYRLNLKRNKYKGKCGKEAQFGKPVLQYSLDGNFIKEWISAAEIKRQLGFCAENIRNVCKGRRKVANGYIWKYKKEE